MASKQRVICGLSVAAVWLLAIFALPVWALAGLVALSAGVCLFELCAMLKKAGYGLPFGTLAAATAGWFALVYAGQMGLCTLGQAGARPAVLAVVCAGLFFRVLLDARIARPMETAALTVVSFLYIPFMLSFLLVLAVSGAGDSAARIFLAFFLVLVTKLCDTGGYFIGSAFGRHKMCPRLSPGKSWEGTAGGYAFSFAAAAAAVGCAHLFPEAAFLGMLREATASPAACGWFFLTIGVVVTVGILGDLLESLFKRQCGVKDSSALFPAMGGFFDTFDSLIFVPAAYLFMQTLGACFL